MTNPKGTRWETRLVLWWQDHGYPACERRARSGRKDRGDIAGLPDVIEAKNCRTVSLAAWCDEAAVEAANNGTPGRWAVVFPRRSHATAKAYVVMSLEHYTDLLRGAA